MVGSAFTIDSRYAKNVDVYELQFDIQVVDQRLNLKLLKDRADALQERIWKYTDRYEDKVMPETVKEMVRDMQKEYDEIMEEIRIKKEVDKPGGNA